MTRAVIGLGSNLGDRAGNLRAALARLEELGIAVIARSSIWESLPVPPGQPAFFNAAAVIETALEPLALLGLLKRIEHALGRRPGRRWGPRPIDLDILYYGELRVQTAELTIPHPEIPGRSFVLAPLVEVLERHSKAHAEALAALGALGTGGLSRTGFSL